MTLDFKKNDHPELFQQLADDALRGLRSMERVAKIALACALASWEDQRQESHHVLLQATNGVAKSTLAENINRALLGRQLVKHYEDHGKRVALRRVQGNPELMPSDLVGGDMLGEDKKLEFKHGPLTAPDPPTFLVMADEINRTGPRTMSGWLQAMAEGYCTVRSLALDEPTLPFVPGWVIATQNPSQHVGTYPLPEAVYDRFMVMLIVGMTSKLDAIVNPLKHPDPASDSAAREVQEKKYRDLNDLKAQLRNELNGSNREAIRKKIQDLLRLKEYQQPNFDEEMQVKDTKQKETRRAKYESHRDEARKLFSNRHKELALAKFDIGFMPVEEDLDQFISKLCYWTWPLDAVRRLRLGTEELVCPHRDVKDAVEPLAQGVSPRAAKALRDLGCAIAWAFKLERVTKELIREIAEPVLSHRLVLRRSAGPGQEGATEAIVRTIVQRAIRS